MKKNCKTFFEKENFRSKRVSPIIRDYICELVGTDPIAERHLLALPGMIQACTVK